MTTQLSPTPVQKFFDNNGNPLANGQLFSYIAGTTTPQATYVDSTQLTQNTNPVILNARGECNLWLDPTLTYKLILQDSLGNQIWSVDQIQGVLGPNKNIIPSVDNAFTLGSATTSFANLYVGSQHAPVFDPVSGNVGYYAQTAAERAASVVPTNFSYSSVPEDPRRFGADPTGALDSSVAFAALTSVGQPAVIQAGTYLFNSSITIAPALEFKEGAILRPAAGITVTLSGAFRAGTYQIFDLSLGGLVALPQEGTGEVWAEWWGAKALPSSKVNNEVPLNQAWYALLQTPVGSGVGGIGTIRLDRGDYFISGTSYHSDSIPLVGRGFFQTLIKANAATWGSQTQMIASQQALSMNFTTPVALGATSATLISTWPNASGTYNVVFFEVAAGACEQRTVTFTNGSASVSWSGAISQNCTNYAVALGYSAIFNCRVENLRLDAADIGTIGAVINAPGWQQKCGTDNVYINNFRQIGINIDQSYMNTSAAYTAYGGPAQAKLRRTEAFAAADCVSGSANIYIYQVGTVGWFSVELEELQLGTNTAPIAFTASVGGATSGTLTANWAFASGAWLVLFSDGESRLVTLTNGATTATWSGALSAGTITTAYGVNPNSNGLTALGANGRTLLNCFDVHFESIYNGLTLQNNAVLLAQSISTGGTADVQNMINCAGSWVGTVNLRGAVRGGAVNFLTDVNRSSYASLANAPGSGSAYPGGQGGGNFSQQFIWPPDPNIPFAGGRFNGATGATQYGYGLSCAHTGGTGVYTFTLSPAAAGSSTYDIEVSSDQAMVNFSVTNASTFTATTRTSAGTAADCGILSVKVYHSS